MPSETSTLNELTPKQQYEKRKAERLARRAKEEDWRENDKKDTADAFDMADRFVTAFERIADVLEKKFA